ncbi:MAG: hypothetical protein NTU53_16980 [Planctomycetota bacterium]|nr:hypothetical protein [Planctomycetota bacterium]
MLKLIKRLRCARRQGMDMVRAAVGGVVEQLEGRRMLDAMLRNGEEYNGF